ncbi:TetR/AcrR family transcriptional regulator C-terminal domain-containing protein [Microlunatus ginsengisoli]|uniref:TetR/AcrR family transcriptional regulator C-terminal domain-containing protein n=1 Tax=Microlunatus ginsengisoli TaxID=363863 RepID=A0ABP7ANU8_9ACTN
MAESTSQRIADELERRIVAGELAPGDLLPSARQITRDWHVAIATATRVHATLRAAGLAETLPGLGVVVRRPSPRPVPADGLQARVIVATALGIADREGLEAVSMRRLATELNTAPTTLYRHVADKDDLLLKMLDTAMGEWRPPPREGAGWRECLEAAARGLWRQFRRHPWLAAALSVSRPPAVAGGIGWTEWVLDVLTDEVTDLGTRFDIHLTLFSYVRGMAVNLEAEAAATALTGMDADEWMDTQLPALRAIADQTDYPQFTALVHQPYDFSLDRIFEQGLGYLLSGLAAELAGTTV